MSIFFQNRRACNDSLAMGYIKADSVFCDLGSSSSIPTMTIHYRIYHYLVTIVSQTNLWPFLLSVYIHDTDIVTKGNSKVAHMFILTPGIFSQLTAISFEFSLYEKSFSALRDCAITVHAHKSYRMIVQNDKRAAFEDGCRYNGPTCLEIGSNISAAENGTVKGREIELHRVVNATEIVSIILAQFL